MSMCLCICVCVWKGAIEQGGRVREMLYLFLPFFIHTRTHLPIHPSRKHSPRNKLIVMLNFLHAHAVTHVSMLAGTHTRTQARTNTHAHTHIHPHMQRGWSVGGCGSGDGADGVWKVKRTHERVHTYINTNVTRAHTCVRAHLKLCVH